MITFLHTLRYLSSVYEAVKWSSVNSDGEILISVSDKIHIDFNGNKFHSTLRARRGHNNCLVRTTA